MLRHKPQPELTVAGGPPDPTGLAGRAAAVGLGLLIAGTVAVFDAAVTPGTVVIGTVVLAPFVVSLLAGPRETGLVAAAAGVLVLVSATWNENFLDAGYLLRVVVVAVGGAVSVLASRGRHRHGQELARSALLTTALANLTEAVTIQDAAGGLVYANQAAADLLGFASPAELLATPAAAIAARFESFREDGSPLELADLPGRRVLDGEEPEPLLVRAIDRRTRQEQWRTTMSAAVRDGAGRVRLVVNVINDVTAAKRGELAQRLLAEAGAALASSLDYERTLQQVADLAVPELADWCALSLPDDRGILRTVAVGHVDAARVAAARELGERYPTSLADPGGAAAVFRDGVPQRLNGITDEMLAAAARDPDHLAGLRRLGMSAALIVPMTSGGRSIGVLSLVSAESGRTFGAGEEALAVELGRRAATAVENARLYTERSEIARVLQAGLLPDELPELAGWRVASLYRPAGEGTEVGGDFYEAFALDGGWMLVVGDVTGRGAEAAALTALMRHTLRTAATLTGSVARALDKLNRDLCRRPSMSLCTAVCVLLREAGAGASARVELTCAGHPLPVLVRDGRVEHVGRFGPLLGAQADQRWETDTVAVGPGEVLVLYSDGVLDTVGAEDRFGGGRLRAALAGAAGAEDAVRRIDGALAAFQVGRQADDTAVLAVERRPVPESPVAETARPGNGEA